MKPLNLRIPVSKEECVCLLWRNCIAFLKDFYRQLFNIPSVLSVLKTSKSHVLPPISIHRLEKEYQLPYFLSSLEAFQLMQVKTVAPAPAR